MVFWFIGRQLLFLSFFVLLLSSHACAESFTGVVSGGNLKIKQIYVQALSAKPEGSVERGFYLSKEKTAFINIKSVRDIKVGCVVRVEADRQEGADNYSWIAQKIELLGCNKK